MSALGIILAVLALGFLIAIHEFGHMQVARWCGMHVRRYSIGFGKVLWSRTKGETTYQFAMIPFGGFVDIQGMDPTEEYEDPDDPRLYQNRPVWARSAVIVAGPVTNYIFAFLFAMLLFGAVGAPYYQQQVGVTLKKIGKNKPADKGGLLPGDILTHIDGREVNTEQDLKMSLQLWRAGFRYVEDPTKREALFAPKVLIERDGKQQSIRQPLDRKTGLMGVLLAKPAKGKGVLVDKILKAPATTAPDGLKPGDRILVVGGRKIAEISELKNLCQGAIEGLRWSGKDQEDLTFWVQRGVELVKRDVRPRHYDGHIGVVYVKEHDLRWKDRGLGNNVKAGFMFPIRQSAHMLGGLRGLFKTGKEGKKVRKGASGPVGIVAYMKREIVAGTDRALLIVIILSCLLGLFNLLPVPALDGGRLLFLGLSAIARRNINPMIEMKIHTYGFMLLLGLIILLTYRDISRLITG